MGCRVHGPIPCPPLRLLTAVPPPKKHSVSLRFGTIHPVQSVASVVSASTGCLLTYNLRFLGGHCCSRPRWHEKSECWWINWIRTMTMIQILTKYFNCLNLQCESILLNTCKEWIYIIYIILYLIVRSHTTKHEWDAKMIEKQSKKCLRAVFLGTFQSRHFKHSASLQLHRACLRVKPQMHRNLTAINQQW